MFKLFRSRGCESTDCFGVMLTQGRLLGVPDPHMMPEPLLAIVIIPVLYRFVSGSWIRSRSPLESTAAMHQIAP